MWREKLGVCSSSAQLPAEALRDLKPTPTDIHTAPGTPEISLDQRARVGGCPSHPPSASRTECIWVWCSVVRERNPFRSSLALTPAGCQEAPREHQRRCSVGTVFGGFAVRLAQEVWCRHGSPPSAEALYPKRIHFAHTPHGRSDRRPPGHNHEELSARHERPSTRVGTVYRITLVA